MPELMAVIDEPGGTALLRTYAVGAGPFSQSGTQSFGPVALNYTVTATVRNGAVDFIPSDTIRVYRIDVDWKLSGSLVIDLNQILPQICLPQVCVKIFKKVYCFPKNKICFPWPVIKVPWHVLGTARATLDFKLGIRLAGNQYQVFGTFLGAPFLQLSPSVALILAAISAALTPALLLVPLIAGFLGIAFNLILGFIGVSAITGFLGVVLTALLGGMEFRIAEFPKHFALLPYQGPTDPAVNMTLNEVGTYIAFTGEDELHIFGSVQ